MDIITIYSYVVEPFLAMHFHREDGCFVLCIKSAFDFA